MLLWVFLHSLRFLLVSLCSFGFLCVPVGSSVFNCVSLGSSGFHGVPLWFIGSLLVYLCSSGFLCVSLGSSWFVWVPMCFLGFLCVPLCSSGLFVVPCVSSCSFGFLYPEHFGNLNLTAMKSFFQIFSKKIKHFFFLSCSIFKLSQKEKPKNLKGSTFSKNAVKDWSDVQYNLKDLPRELLNFL